MFNNPPRFLESNDIINIVDNIPIPKKEKVLIKIDEPSLTVNKVVEENIILSKDDSKPKFEEMKKVETKNKSSVKEYRYAGDDIPWLY